MKKSIIKKAVQKGFTLVELATVIAIIGLLAAIFLPNPFNYILTGKIEPTAADINKIVAAIRQNANGQGATPYTGMTTAVFATSGRGKLNTLTITGTGTTATIQHDIGATGSQITAASATITTAGDAFTVTVPTVSELACPQLAAQMARTAEVITINGTSVKAVGGTYNGTTAQPLCTAGNTNSFVFTYR
jgi:type IV pilus assembly protein PilA